MNLSLERFVKTFAELRTEIRRVRLESMNGHFSALADAGSDEVLDFVVGVLEALQ